MENQNQQATSTMQVPNWLIALELCAGAALLYVSSSALVDTDMHISRSQLKPATEIESEAPTTSSTEATSNETKIIVSASTL